MAPVKVLADQKHSKQQYTGGETASIQLNQAGLGYFKKKGGDIEMVGIKDYENMDGFGLSTWEEVSNLNKALSAGYDVPATSGGVSGSALRVESLEASLKVITFQMQHIKLWQKIPKLPAYSTVEEYNRLISYGGDGGAFFPEGELGEYDDTTYSRQVSLVKYLQTVRKVSHPLTLIRAAHGDVIGNEVRNGIMWLLGKIENYLFWGSRALRFNYPTNEGYQFDGLDSLIDTTMVVDAMGDPLSEDLIETASNMVIENYGIPTDIFIGTKPLSDLAKVMFPKERIIVPFKEGQVGTPLNTFASQGGTLAFNPDVFLRKRYVIPATTAATSTKAPLAPVLTSAIRSATGATPATTGDWTKTSNGWGTYRYSATANNRYGESAPSASVAGDAIIADADYYHVIVTNNGAADPYPVEWINLYRTVAGGGATANHYLVQQWAATTQAAGVANTTAHDLNGITANSHKVFIGEMTPQVFAFKQLAPMMKMDLATVEPSIRWLQLLYGTPQMYATRKWVRIINIGEHVV